MRRSDSLSRSRLVSTNIGGKPVQDAAQSLIPTSDLGGSDGTLTAAAPPVNCAVHFFPGQTAADGHWRDYRKPFQCFGPLLTVREILARDSDAGFSVYPAQEQKALLRFAEYATTFLSAPHADLGRAGNVCPYVPDAIDQSLFRLTSTRESEPAAVLAAMENMRSVFAALEPTSGPHAMLKTIVVVFPEVEVSSAGATIGALQKWLKPSYVREGFMIGEFYPTCPEPGLHNPAFRPLDTPVPALAIRYITKFDAPFMLGDPAYEAGYVERFGDEGVRRLTRLKARSAGCPVQH